MILRLRRPLLPGGSSSSWGLRVLPVCFAPFQQAGQEPLGLYQRLSWGGFALSVHRPLFKTELHAPLKCKGAWETWSSDRKGNKMLGRPRVLSQAFWGHILKGWGHEKITKDGVLYLVNGKRYALIFLDELIFSAFQLTVRNWICGTQWQGMWLTNVLILGLTGEYVFKSPFSF